ncbi:phospholipid-binding protein MlaC [Testudinibacter sp. TR-2022]|uniref:phospholipid-binding protein MlaC n=1 Tax=Testudinibacter sp. TR-2022 TaxID=2585029 RepID=UPI00111BB9B1|nr:phospholipid-binding protein MlaC [Testudinibacter sp. TR-2022]TNH04009.1 phospholipid-binding protein MlaC [Pasteurellaceae bacterium Phil31]TNH08803.1 phospholipid-binding protein MlaC [Testudinibacter sp. TR-2022]TNH11413.1 phospholipid-binding protein MlaC [Testudinibacter sp. TR-2022]TNH11479.1 phospholipid-binding protein MlaC [Testudinibacter sp. TR-2022]TNH17416.1 phospholipid-binding protein MlaC [Testudinibacter sp. TR-2022]
MLKKVFKKCAVVMVAVMSLFGAMQAVAADNPYQLMQQASDKLFASISANQSKIKQNPDYMRTIVKQELMPYVHVNYAGSLVLGQYFKSTTPAQREQFFTAFSNFIEQSYAQVLTMYNNQNIEIEREKPIGDQNIVSIRVNIIQTNGAAPIKLDFKWRKNTRTGAWQAYDMAAEGVSMVETKKNEWSNILRQKGIDELTAQIQKSAAIPIKLEK